MSHNPDIAFAIAETLASGELVVVPELTPDHGSVKESEANILVQGHISGTATIQTLGSVIVEGAIMGSFVTPCRIVAGGDVIVIGSVLNAHITSRTVLVGGEARDSYLGVQGRATIEQNLVDSEIVLGDLSSSKPQVEAATTALSQIVDQQDILTRQIQHDAAFLHSACNTPRFEINLSVGKIIRHDKKEISIDLEQFYQHLQKDKDQDFDSVLNEFFNKGVIGLLSRVNRAYFAQNQAQERVFLKLMNQLRKLVSLVRQRDLVKEQVNNEQKQIGALLGQLTDPHRLLKVQGRVFPEVLIRCNRPDIELGEGGQCKIKDRPVDLVISPGSTPEEYRLQRRSQANPMRAEDLRSVAFKLDDDEQIEILPLSTDAPVQAPAFRDSHILVIEDARKMRTFMVEALARASFDRIEDAEDGQQALALLANAQPDLILLEWDLIAMKGLECMRALGEHAVDGELAVIAITSRGSEESVATATREGAAGYLLKPFTAEELVDKVEEVLTLQAQKRDELKDPTADVESLTL